MMSEIQSDMSKTYQIYSAINNKVSMCSDTSTPDKDESTTVDGNKNAHDTIDKLLAMNKSVTSAIEKANESIRDVGESFDVTDTLIGNDIAK